jgi:hypothetical protein
MKKLSVVLATAGLAASLGAYAALPTTAQPFQLEVPNLKPGLLVTLEGDLLRPTSNANYDYAAIDSFTFNGFLPFGAANGVTLTGTQSISTVNPSYEFGFRVGLGYIFPDSGNDIQLNWTHFDNDDNDSSVTSVPGTVLITGLGVPLINFNGGTFAGFNFDGFDIPSSVSASSSVDNKMDAVDLDVGQYVNVGTRLQMRFFGGLRAARVEQNISDSYYGTWDFSNFIGNPALTNVLSYNEFDSFDSEFKGIGPRFGVDSSYHVWDCFGVVAHVSAALLVGETETSASSVASFTTSQNNFPNLFPLTFATNINQVDENRVVPNIDAALGIDYTWEFVNRSTLTIEAGYKVSTYIDAVDKFDIAGNFGGLGAPERDSSTVSYDGPYLALNFHV